MFRLSAYYVKHKIVAKTISVKQKKRRRGRPATGHDPFVGIRLPPDLIEAIDAWGKQEHAPSRSEAIRRLLEQGLQRRKS
jgi:hypothetical protein